MKAIKAIYSLLTANANITATVYPTRVLELDSFPAITLTQISRTPNDTKKEYSKSDVVRLQVNSIGNTATEAFDLSIAVRDAMLTEIPAIFNGVLVQNIAFDDEQIIMSDGFGLEGATIVAQDYLIMYANAEIVVGSMLKEDGDLLLLESGDEIIL